MLQYPFGLNDKTLLRLVMGLLNLPKKDLKKQEFAETEILEKSNQIVPKLEK
jgi:hypothetical protein